MKKVLLKETKIGEFLTIGVEMEEDEVGIFIASADVSASCAFKFDEWEKFVAGINKADKIFKKRE
ncbi:MAG: hypothetical protein U9Q18_06265 [Caldisericota bacterium]|nr:hypothetical protein [Caldisericota bacterium]